MPSALVLALLPLAPPSLGPAPRPVQDDAPPLLIRAERVIVRPGEELADAAVLVERGRIIAVGHDLSAPEGARELSGKVVCAGFVDPWSTVGLDPGSAADLGTSPASLSTDGIDRWSDVHLLQQALRAGVTSARVQAGVKAQFGGVGALVRSDPALEGAQATLLRDACVATSIGVTRGGRLQEIFDRVAEVDRLAGQLEKGKRYGEERLAYARDLAEWEKTIAEKEAELEKDFKKAKKDREKEMEEAEEKDKEFKEKRHKEEKKPRKPKYDADDEVMQRVVQGELPLVVEVHRAEEIRTLLEKTRPFERLRLVLAGATEGLPFAETLEERRIPVIVWPEPLGEAKSDEHDAHDLSLAGELARRGVQVLIGSGGEREVRDLRLLTALAVGNGLEPSSALSAITLAPASVFDVRGRLGSVERGKDADLLVLDGDPLDTTARIQFVISHGEVVVEP